MIYLFAAIVGVCAGSFLNVVADRLPCGNFFASSRSYCPACKRKLTAVELIPVVSFLFLKGHCKTCGAKIPLRYPLVEIAGGLLAVCAVARFGVCAQAALTFAVTCVLLTIALIDHDTMQIPDALNIALVPFALLAVFICPEISLLSRVIGLFCVSMPMLILTLIIHGAFGGGDMKLMAVCGFLLGWQSALLAFVLALLTGGGYAAYLLISKKGKPGTHIAFGPHLCFGIAVALFFGPEIVRWYMGLLGF